MRGINQEITVTKESTITYTATSERIVGINENKNSQVVYVQIELSSSDGTVLKEESLVITDADYDLLMQGNPSYAPQKPVNEYRESDIWHIVDLVRSRQ
ncbi:hypothetical protein [Paenibacillus sp. B-A-8]|uniref:hypothetical protein n=1 Tax=Paenibacillus sp. B-A-8 TaxID=3400419 RepID=UPI003B021B63